MNPLSFAKYVRKQSKTTPTTLDDDTLLLYMNIVKNDDIVPEIAKCNEDIFGMVAYRDLVWKQREYSFPEYILNNIKYFEVDRVLFTNPEELQSMLHPTSDSCPQPQQIASSGRYKRCEELDINTTHNGTDELSIRAYMQGKPPAFDIFRNSYWLYTAYEVPPIRDGLKAHYIRFPSDIPNLTSTTDMSNDMIHPISAGIPLQFHLIWADMVIVMVKNSREKPIPLTQQEANIKARMQSELDAIKGMNLDRVLQATVPRHDDGQNY